VLNIEFWASVLSDLMCETITFLGHFPTIVSNVEYRISNIEFMILSIKNQISISGLRVSVVNGTYMQSYGISRSRYSIFDA
jgi:hypothetical protein